MDPTISSATAIKVDVPILLDVSGLIPAPSDAPLTYSITGLPEGTGLSVDPNLGRLQGSATETDLQATQPIPVTIVASDANGAASSISFLLLVEPATGGRLFL